MKSYPISIVAVLLLFLFCNSTQAQSFGIKASAVWVTDCNQSNFYNTSGNPADLIGPSGNVFDNTNFGVHTQNSGSLILRGASVKTFKNPASSNVCVPHLFYRVYPQATIPGSFIQMDLPFLENCSGSTFPSGGPCIAGDQKWELVIPDGTITPYAPVNLTSLAPGNYALEVYYDVTGSNSSTSLCNETATVNNSSNNYKAFFSIQDPTILNSTNPSTCSGTNGSITIQKLVPGTIYNLTYLDDGVTVGPAAFTADGFGHIVITGLNKGFYSDFLIEANGCTTPLNQGAILSDPVFVPSFPAIPPFCAGSTPPTLPSMSTNGFTGNWSPAVIDNQTSGTYTFTPSANQCGVPVTRTVTVTQPTVPNFSIGSGLNICAGAGVPSLPNTSTNGITGTWSPAVIDNQNSAVYTFTPDAGFCATTRTFTVNVNPNIPPTFSFGSSLSICPGGTVPALPTTSDNNIVGVWSPSVVDNQNSATYTFTPNSGQCATTASFSVTVNPNITPTFSFGTSSSICSGASVPALPTTSDNGITGTWNPSSVDNLNSATYTFTLTAGQCATTASFSVTINPNITPTFSFGSGITICAGGIVPSLPTTSNNGISGTWSPAPDNQHTTVYTFTPTAGLCATTRTFTVTVNPNIVPAFNFGTTLTICSGEPVPTLPNASTNNVTGTWSPSVVSNLNSGTYTFTPNPGFCATPATFTVNVNPNIIPSFSFGTSLNICAGEPVPTLPTTSSNGITGTWNPTVVSDQNSGTYTFTPTAGQCATAATFSVTVNPNIVPTFSFGTSLTICAGGTVPALPTTSSNGIAGIWNPSVVDNQNSATYTFTPTSGLCATTATFSVTVNPNIIPTFDFGTTLGICAGAPVPVLPTISSNSVTGTWSPSVVNNQNSGVYTFTPDAGQCIIPSTVTFTVTVTPNIIPVFTFGTTLSICAGETVPVLPTTSLNGVAGTWNPSAVNNQSSGTYVFTPTPVSGQCIIPATFVVTVNAIVTPTFSFGTFQSLCIGATVPTLSTLSANGVTGTWNPAVIDNTINGTYTFTPNPGQCATTTTFELEVHAIPTLSSGSDTSVYDGASIPQFNFTVSTGANINWTNTNPTIGLAASGTGNIPSFKATNLTNSPVTGTVTATPQIGGCSGTAQQYVITVLPLNKDVFVPNVFTPNRDGKNDQLLVYGTYITKLDMRIFNQWGQLMTTITDKSQGWDGTYKGSPQPVGVYVYVLKAELSTGQAVTLKGSITLIR